ncbi:MAG TPA: sugar phosphate isomerase/epimerase family protein [Planctomycetota bacterium]|nr:sugar phosphate isomerase/epimerase family protein [Planctomycetota bacterium]
MRIGLCEKDLRGDLRANLEWMSAAGIEGYQIWKGKLDGSGMSPEELLALSGDLGLDVTAVGGGPNLVDPAVAQQSIGLFRSFLDLSVALGCRIVTAESKRRPDGLSDADAWRSTTDTVRAICRHAESVGAVLAIECSGGCFVRHQDDFLKLAGAVGSPALKVNMDPANIVLAGRDVLDAVRSLAPYIVHTHAKDIARADTDDEPARDVPAGEGLVSYPEYLAALRDLGYDGWLTIEMHAGKTERTDDIAKSVTNLRHLLDRI